MDQKSLYSAKSFEEIDSLLQGRSYDEIMSVSWSLRCRSELFVRWLIERFPERRREQEPYVVQHDIAQHYNTNRLCKDDLVQLVDRRCHRILAVTLPLFKAKGVDLNICGHVVPPDPYHFFYSSFGNCLDDLRNEMDATKHPMTLQTTEVLFGDSLDDLRNEKDLVKRLRTLRTAELLFDHYTDYLVDQIKQTKAQDEFFDLVRVMVKVDAVSLLQRLSTHIDLTTFHWTEAKYAENIKPWRMSPLALALLCGSTASFDYLKSLESDKTGESRATDLLYAVVMKRHDSYDHVGAISYLFSHYRYGKEEIDNARRIALDKKGIFNLLSAELEAR